jgi:hypothetical protein
VIGMSGAILQGVPATTLDTDLWIDRPSRQYMGVINICRGLGFTHLSNTKVLLTDGSEVDFVYEPSGLQRFDLEYRRARFVNWMGSRLPVLPLERIYRSKKAAGRPKDLAQLPLISTVLRARRRIGKLSA